MSGVGGPPATFESGGAGGPSATFESDGATFGGASVFASDGAGAVAPPPPAWGGSEGPTGTATGYPVSPLGGNAPTGGGAVPPKQQVMRKPSEAHFGTGGHAPSVLPGFNVEGAPSCGGGGCCSGMPAGEVYDTNRQLVRLNIPYYPEGCCSQHNGIDEKFMHGPPEILKSRGIDESTWKTWVGHRGLGRVQALRGPCCPGCLCCLFITIITPCFLPG